MTQEDKELLLKDICARLPYGLKVKCEKYSFPVTIFYTGNIDEVKFKETGGIENICAIKPYLFHLSSMTVEQCYELASIRSGFQDCFKYIKTPIPLSICNFEQIDWFHKNHFDYRGLIEKGLAIDATNLNIY